MCVPHCHWHTHADELARQPPQGIWCRGDGMRCVDGSLPHMCTPLSVLRLDQCIQVTPEIQIQWVKTTSFRRPRYSPYSSYQSATNKLFYFMFPALWGILYNYVIGAWYFEKSAVCQSTDYWFLWKLLLCLQRPLLDLILGQLNSFHSFIF
jgi:hypothetical protein